MVTTDDPDVAARVRTMSLHGLSRDAWNRYTAEGSWYYEILYPGYKYNLTDIAAALGGGATARNVNAFGRHETGWRVSITRVFAIYRKLFVPMRRPMCNTPGISTSFSSISIAAHRTKRIHRAVAASQSGMQRPFHSTSFASLLSQYRRISARDLSHGERGL